VPPTLTNGTLTSKVPDAACDLHTASIPMDFARFAMSLFDASVGGIALHELAAAVDVVILFAFFEKQY
jgi:hypothetical protein